MWDRDEMGAAGARLKSAAGLSWLKNSFADWTANREVRGAFRIGNPSGAAETDARPRSQSRK